MSRVWRATAVIGALVGASLAAQPPAVRRDSTALRVIREAITQRGGLAAARNARALMWEGDAIVAAGGRNIPITGQWRMLLPDSVVVATREAMRDSTATRRLIIAGPRGWQQRAGGTAPLDSASLAHEREQFFLYFVLCLAPLLDDNRFGVRLVAAEMDGTRRIVVEAPGRMPVTLWIAPSGEMTSMANDIVEPGTGAIKRQRLWFSGRVTSAGFQWPARIRITQDGEPYFDLSIRRFEAARTLRDPLWAGPPASVDSGRPAPQGVMQEASPPPHAP